MQIENKHAIEIIKDLEAIRVSFAKIGSRNAGNIEQLALTLLHHFIKYETFKKISKAHHLMVESAESDAALKIVLDDIFEGFEYPIIDNQVTISDIYELINKNSIE